MCGQGGVTLGENNAPVDPENLVQAKRLARIRVCTRAIWPPEREQQAHALVLRVTHRFVFGLRAGGCVEVYREAKARRGAVGRVPAGGTHISHDGSRIRSTSGLQQNPAYALDGVDALSF
jgi:hypothetical protein